MSFYKRNLRDGEQIIELIRKHWITNITKYIIITLFVLVAFFFAVPLFNWGILGQIIFALLLAVSVFELLKVISLNYFNCLLITTQRMIDFSQKENFERKVKEIDFVDIFEVSHTIKGLQNLIKTGTVFVKTKASQGKNALVIKNISNPQKLQDLILDLKKLAIEEELLKQKQVQTQEDYAEILQRMKKDMGREGIERLLKELE